LTLALGLVLAAPALAQEEDRAARFPAAKDGRLILTADLHTHSVFSDGHVWPTIRVEEAHRDGINLLAVTEHLEAQPKKADIPHPDRNRSFQVATEALTARGFEGLSVVNGAEVTRSMPPGHVNAVFLKDANALLTEDPEQAIRRANEQGAFVFWNHPNWIPQAPDAIARITDLHKRWIKAGLLHGVEVINGTLDGHSEHALQIALDHGLTVLGTSDIHGLVDWTHKAGHGGHRPMTIVFAKDGSPEEMKKALFAGATVAWSYDDLLGREDNVKTLVDACLSLQPTGFEPRSTVLKVGVRNDCPINFTLRNTSEATFQNFSDVIRVERNSTLPLTVRLPRIVSAVSLSFEVLNAQVGFRKSPVFSLSAVVAER
jgi:hypothetical protein